LIGNVTEWLGVCNSEAITTSPSPCLTSGGGYADTIDNVRCDDHTSTRPKSTRAPDLGFRCCYDLTLVELQDAGLL